VAEALGISLEEALKAEDPAHPAWDPRRRKTPVLGAVACRSVFDPVLCLGAQNRFCMQTVFARLKMAPLRNNGMPNRNRGTESLRETPYFCIVKPFL
jgi:hypothetical protein